MFLLLYLVFHFYQDHGQIYRKSMVCYPLFNSRKYKVKRGDNFARKKLDAEDQS
jgi:hypothetical protein